MESYEDVTGRAVADPAVICIQSTGWKAAYRIQQVEEQYKDETSPVLARPASFPFMHSWAAVPSLPVVSVS